MKRTGAKVKISRQLGIAITPKAARILEKRPNPPGQHGENAGSRRKISEYKKQLLEKQKLRAQYFVTERQMRRYYAMAKRAQGDTGRNLIGILESRLDAVALRGGFAPTIYAARQLVTHGHVMLNGRKASIPSMNVKPGSVVTLTESGKKIPASITSLANVKAPAYLDVDKDKAAVKLLEVPMRDKVPVICEIGMVVEFYSR